MSDRVAEAISDINLAWRNRRPGAEIISEQQCRHIAQELRAMGLVTVEGEEGMSTDKATAVVEDVLRANQTPMGADQLWGPFPNTLTVGELASRISEDLALAGLFPRTVTTVDEVDALDPQALLMTERDELWKAGSIPAIMLPATVIWQPEAKA